ncbi:hypothetical protein AB0D12_36115 [Streptomyces sp. NPDC048479]|uniref:hypothetical protein n=1 Tax=Streptomyces sp. NPDC048479 TaxID=3154725 RepID=UPI00342C29D9
MELSRNRSANQEAFVSLDGVLVLAHSEERDAAATWKKTFGHHPLMAFVDHGRGGSGEPVAALLRPATRAATPPSTTSPRPNSPWPNSPWPSCRRSTGASGRH